jgi:hypothetical protein
MAISTLIHSDLEEISSIPRSNSSSLLRQNTTTAIHFDEGSSNNLLPIAFIQTAVKPRRSGLGYKADIKKIMFFMRIS